MRLSPEDIEDLTADKVDNLGMPSLAEIDHALWLIRKKYPIDAWYLRNRLKWLMRKMKKHYGVEFDTPWKK